MDQHKSNAISSVFGYVLVAFGILMFVLGISMLGAESKGSMEFTLITLFIMSGGALIYGGINTFQSAKTKEVEVNIYEQQLYKKLLKQNNNSSATAIPNSVPDVSSLNASTLEYVNSVDANNAPDIIANWTYTPEEWKLMNREELIRRIKEGVWVTLIVALAGALLLYFTRGSGLLLSISIAGFLGVFVSVLKLVISADLFNSLPENHIIISTNAILINGKFKTISDANINLEYIKKVEWKNNPFIEFSLRWNTRNGTTNDQFRIYVPPRYTNEIPKVLTYFYLKGVGGN